MTKIPNWASSHLSADSIGQVNGAIVKAESTTSGEIVPMIVHRSSTVGHVPVVVLCLLAIVYLALDLTTYQTELFGEQWIWAIYGINIVLLILITSFLSKIHFVQRKLTSKVDLVDQVDMRSEIEFYESNITNTRDGTGILLFVSLMEHRAVVLADKAIKDKVSEETWSEVCSILITGIKKGDMSMAFTDAIKKCGEVLTPHFPVKTDDTNELNDHLIIKE